MPHITTNHAITYTNTVCRCNIMSQKIYLKVPKTQTFLLLLLEVYLVTRTSEKMF